MSTLDANLQHAPSSRFKILCIDDESDILSSIEESLAPLGHDVLKCGSAEEAVSVIARESSRLVLIVADYKMPGMSGLDLRRQTLDHYKDIPFIILSAYTTRDMALTAVDLKISAFLDKPFRVNHLLETAQKELKDRALSLAEEAELIAGFVSEASSLLEEMEQLVLELEDGEPDPESLNRIFACAHTIKGASGFFKPDTIHRFTHRYEDFFSRIKANPSLLTQHSVGILLKGIDILKKLIGELQHHSATPSNLDELLTLFLDKDSTTKEGLPQTKVSSGAKKLKNSAQPDKQKSDDLRVSISLLDAFMEKSGELTVLRNMINKLLRIVEKEYPGNKNISALSDLLSELHKVNGQVQDQISDLRKVPLRQIFKPLSRTLRDLTVALKKSIDLRTKGDELRVDHSLADLLSNSLIHMLRNSVDHGIESSDQRKVAQKPERGLIRIEANEDSDAIIVKVSDDGRGINTAVVKEKAVEKKLLTPEQVQNLSEDDARMLIFLPGFSTAAEVTDVSGRGVGTDMVMKSILSIGGHIRVASDVGKGTEFTIHLPLPKSVLIISSLIVKNGESLFALPQENILRITKLKDDTVINSVKSSEGATFFQELDRLLPLFSLQHVLSGLKFTPIDSQYLRDRYIIWVQSKSYSYCLLVDDILDIEDTVVKKLCPGLQRILMYSGATFLGNGVGLILNVDGIAKSYDLSSGAVATSANSPEPQMSATPLRDFLLLYHASSKHVCGSLWNQVFRLEEFATEDLQFSGSQPVVVYRDQTMPIYCLAGLISPEASGDSPAVSLNGPITVIVVEHKSQFIGLRVHHINDLVEIKSDTQGTGEGLDGKTLRIIANKTVTLVDLQSVVAQIPRRRSQTQMTFVS